jgi:hypothetical protein
LVVVSCDLPVALSVSVTVAPTTTAFVWSVTVPTTVPALPCAHASDADNKTTIAAAARRNTREVEPVILTPPEGEEFEST